MFNFGASAAPQTKDPLEERRAKFASSLLALNENFASWVQNQDKTETWTDGVEDYLSYAKDLLTEYDDVIKSVPGEASGTVFSRLAAPPSSNFGAATAATTTTALVTFNFAAAPASGAAFGAFNTAGVNDDKEDDEEEEEEEEGPSVELGSSSAEILLSQRVNLTSLDGETKKWKDRGAGMVSLRRGKDLTASSSAYLVFTTDSGRILLNAPLVKGLKPQVPAKKPQCLLMMLFSKVEDAPEDKGFQLFKCQSVDAQQALLAKINELLGA